MCFDLMCFSVDDVLFMDCIGKNEDWLQIKTTK